MFFLKVDKGKDSCFSSGTRNKHWWAFFAGRLSFGHFIPALRTGQLPSSLWGYLWERWKCVLY